MNKKANVVITESMQLAIKAESEKLGIPESAVLREILASELKKRGYKVSSKPGNWGGARKKGVAE